MASIQIDGQSFDVDPSKHLLETALSLGFDLPYFCWHPALGSVGSCRQCAITLYKDENDADGRLVMACMTPVTDRMRIGIQTPDARAFRAQVIEWLMQNHPHDCPVCDEGGECHLQDMTVMTGHTLRRHRFPKRTYRNQDLGPFLNHEMNRCIQCYRCVRFYRDYAGGRDLEAFGAHDHVYFGRHEDGALENEFSGNLVEVCPTGVFTDKTLKAHYVRKWDLQSAPSVCVHCGLGCNTTVGERGGLVRRIQNRYHPDINGHFLCDRGRFGYLFTEHPKRVRELKVSRQELLRDLGAILADRGRLVGIGSPRASLESNWALRELVGADRFYAGFGATEAKMAAEILAVLRRIPAASIAAVERADAVLVLGEDVPDTAPRLALAIRQSVRNRPMEIPRAMKIPDWLDHPVRAAIQDERGPLYIATPDATRLDDVATRTVQRAPDDIARLGAAIASGDSDPFARAAAEALREAERPVIVAGMLTLDIVRAAAHVAGRFPRAQIAYAVPECNTLGLAMIDDRSVEEAFRTDADTVIILENDLYRRAPARRIDALLRAARHVIVLDSILTRTAEQAEYVIPAATFAESTGTLVNNEGRAQRFIRASASGTESWRWLRDLAIAAGREGAESWKSADDVLSAAPALREARLAAPREGPKVPRQTERSTGRTAGPQIREPKPPSDPDSPLVFSMEGFRGTPPGPLIPRFWLPAWNSIQAVNRTVVDPPPGVRLWEAHADGHPPFTEPEAFQRREGEWLLVPRRHVFGSEELSALSPPIAERTPAPAVAMNPDDAEGLGREVIVTLGDESWRFALEIRKTVPRGVAMVPGVPGLPAWGRIRS